MIKDYNIFFAALVAFIGLFIGELLARINPEEMKPGKKYFRFFEVFFIIVIALLALILLKFNIYLFVLGIVVGFFVKRAYPYLASILFSGETFIFGLLTFIYGLFYGTLERPLKKLRLLILDFVVFFCVGAVIWYFKLDLSSLGAGALITMFAFKMKSYKK